MTKAAITKHQPAPAESIEAWAARFGAGWLRDGGSRWSDEMADSVIDALTSPGGRRLLWALVDETATVPSIRFDSHLQDRLEGQGAKTRDELKQHLKAIIDVVSARVQEAGPQPDAGPAEQTLARAGEILAGFGVKTGIPQEVFEILDHVKGAALDKFGQPAPGVIAAAAAFVISATANADRYRHGKIRWDDAIDTTAGDTVKGGVTGVILDAVLVALGGTVSPPVAIAVVTLLAPLVYAVVGEVVDFAYFKLLGGDAIMEARSLHVAFLQEAAFARHELWPRIRRMRQAGLLVDRLNTLETLGDATGDARKTVRADARRRLADFQGTARRLPLASAFTGAFESRVLAFYASAKGLPVPDAGSPSHVTNPAYK